jgi:hypothetical protein
MLTTYKMLMALSIDANGQWSTSFFCKRGGKLLNGRYQGKQGFVVGNIFGDFFVAAGLDWCAPFIKRPHFHTIPHRCVTHLLEEGFDIHYI